MFTVDHDRSRRLLTVCYTGEVDAREMNQCMKEVEAATDGSESRLRVLTDLSDLESMDEDCAKDLGAIMDLLASNDLEKVICVIPDPTKDIGFGLMSRFHYDHRTPLVTCESLDEAMQCLDKGG